MSLFFRILCKRKLLVFATVASTGLTIAVSLWWNMQLSEIINIISTGNPLPRIMIVLPLVTMFIMGIVNYIATYLAGCTCENITHDLRMGYARYIVSLSVPEAEKLNVGEQLSKLQNEISGVSDYTSVCCNAFSIGRLSESSYKLGTPHNLF